LNDSEIVDDGGAETMRFFKNLFVEKSREVADSWWGTTQKIMKNMNIFLEELCINSK
jgi:hypothetical protein